MEHLPSLFVSHGAPTYALEPGLAGAQLNALGRVLPQPKAVLVVSPHWMTREAQVTGGIRPRTIHDFGGFPRPLHEFQYPAPGAPELAARVQALLAPLPVAADTQWGLDHGTWSVLCHVFPDADVPVVQLSMDETQPAAFHYEIGRRIAPLRDEGVLVIGSGNLVHNLHAYAWGRHPAAPFDWALRFEERARELITASDHAPLVAYETLGRDALLSAPTPDHYLPLLYVLGARHEDDVASFPVAGIDGGSVSMMSVALA